MNRLDPIPRQHLNRIVVWLARVRGHSRNSGTAARVLAQPALCRTRRLPRSSHQRHRRRCGIGGPAKCGGFQARENSRIDANRPSPFAHACRNTDSTAGGRPGTRGARGCGSRLMILDSQRATYQPRMARDRATFPKLCRPEPTGPCAIDFFEHACSLLGRHVVRRAHDGRCAGQFVRAAFILEMPKSSTFRNRARPELAAENTFPGGLRLAGERQPWSWRHGAPRRPALTTWTTASTACDPRDAGGGRDPHLQIFHHQVGLARFGLAEIDTFTRWGWPRCD